MKNTLVLGAMLGIVATTAIYGNMMHNPVKKAKKAFLEKMEEVLM